MIVGDNSETDRDERGRFVPGHSIKPLTRPGRPRTEDAEKLRAALSLILDNGTLPKWTRAMKKKLARGDEYATTFVFDRIAGKVPNIADVAEDGILAALLEQLITLGGPDDGTP